jgi:radical SAM superfamily enzyme YgiQ (UPF0313 family)
MIHRPKGKVVLYQPHQVDKSLGKDVSRDMLPLEVLSIAALPEEDGYEVVIVDGNLYDQEEAHRRLVEACEGAMLYGTTGILGYMVTDSYLASRKVRAAYPELKMVIGGWFASVRPDLQLDSGVYDAVVVGQGELPFRDIVNAVACGEPLDEIDSLVVKRDGEILRNQKHPVVGWDKLPNMPYHLIDIEPYREGQVRADSHGDILRMPSPPWIGERKPYFGISYFSSFGCPEPCEFCCSPIITDRRWKCMPAERMLDHICELKERWNFDVVRFHDANFGVMEKRVREFAQGLLDREVNIGWNAFIETHSILSYDPKTLDLMAESGMHVAEIGAETGNDEFMKAHIGKQIKGDDNVKATAEMDRRGIECAVTYVIGFPHESEENMLETLDQARRVQLVSRRTSPNVFPYRPIPGTKMWDQALELGFEPPKGLLDWGALGQYHVQETWPGRIPARAARTRRLFCHYQTLNRGLVHKRQGLWEKLAKWRLNSGNYSLGALEAKAFDVYRKIERKLSRSEEISRQWTDQGHETGTGDSSNTGKVDKARSMTSATVE